MLAKVDRITDVKERMQMYKYIDSVQESLRNEAREVRDAHFEAVRDPMRAVAKLELKKKNKELNRGYRFINI
jgi:predicted Zn-dependent protease